MVMVCAGYPAREEHGHVFKWLWWSLLPAVIPEDHGWPLWLVSGWRLRRSTSPGCDRPGQPLEDLSAVTPVSRSRKQWTGPSDSRAPAPSPLIHNSGYEESLARAKERNVVYCDPLYNHSQAILYGAQGFSPDEMFRKIEAAKRRGVFVALSSMAPRSPDAPTAIMIYRLDSLPVKWL